MRIHKRPLPFELPDHERRRLSQGLVGAAAAFAWPIGGAFAQPAAVQPPAELSGTDFDLRIGAMPVSFSGSPRTAVAVNGSIPAPTLRWREGTTVTLRVTNTLSVATSIHWHGILLPFQMDGVPGISFPGIAPGETFVYRFPVIQTGTYWYHSHSAFQEQLGLYGALILEPKAGERMTADRDHVVFLSDWTDEDPERLFSKLKAMPDFLNYQEPTAVGFVQDVRQMGLAAAWRKRAMWQQMRMSPTDLIDVSSATYTYLVNGATPAQNWTALARPGERVRLRFINGSASSIFDVRIPGLKMTVVSADGQDVEPVTVDEFRISTAETYDAIVQLPDDRAYTIFGQSIDRKGYARATLAPRQGMQAPIPPLDPTTWLTMLDMGMSDMAGMDHGGMQMGATEMPTMDHGAVGGMSHGAAGDKGGDMQHGQGGGMQHGAQGMEHGQAGMRDGASGSVERGAAGMQHGARPASSAASAPHDMKGMPAMGGMKDMQDMDMSDMADKMTQNTGVSVDMRAISPSTSRADPGPRLRNNGRRVLTYADLHTIGGPVDPRMPSREVVLHLTGNMERFIWGFDGKKFSQAEPVRLNLGERMRIVLVNDTMMSHPIHLHGMWSEVEDENGNFLVRKHTVNVHPGHRISYAVKVDAPGQWAFHCHLLYHMEAGMFRKVVVS